MACNFEMLDLRPSLSQTPPRPGHVWRNLYFLRTRGTLWAQHGLPREEDCIAWSKAFFAEVEDYLRDGGSPFDVVATWDGRMIELGEFLFAIPLPWSGDDPFKHDA